MKQLKTGRKSRKQARKQEHLQQQWSRMALLRTRLQLDTAIRPKPFLIIFVMATTVFAGYHSRLSVRWETLEWFLEVVCASNRQEARLGNREANHQVQVPKIQTKMDLLIFWGRTSASGFCSSAIRPSFLVSDSRLQCCQRG